MSSARSKKSPTPPQDEYQLVARNKTLLEKKGYSVNPACLVDIQPLEPKMLLENSRMVIFHMCDGCQEVNRNQRTIAGDVRITLCAFCNALNYALRYGSRRDIFLPEGGKTGRQMTSGQGALKSRLVAFPLCEGCAHNFANQHMDDPSEFTVDMCNYCHQNQFISRFDMTQQLNLEKYLIANPGKRRFK